MATPYITIGCPTTGGGKVISGNSMFLIEGIAIACVGDKATCPKHKTVSTIVSGDPHMQIFGKSAARVNDSLSCGCKLLPKQNLVVQDNGGGSASSAAKSSPAPLAQNQPAMDNFVKDEYENYYIDNLKEERVEFKNFLFPYDQDKGNLIGIIAQGVSGKCTFVVNRKNQNTSLFVSVTLLPPVLRNDAKIYPKASIQLLKKGKPLGPIKPMPVGEGFWNTEKDMQPVGSIELTLPPPDLEPVTVKLRLSYTGWIDGGQIVPNPSYTNHEFTITSAARRKK